MDIGVATRAEPLDFKRLGIIGVMGLDAARRVATLTGVGLHEATISNSIPDRDGCSALLGIPLVVGSLSPLNGGWIARLIGRSSRDAVRKGIPFLFIDGDPLKIG